jgi:hypothetical protein
MQAHSLAVAQKEFGDSNPQMVPVLTADAGELRKPGKAQDTAKLDKRAAELQSATVAAPPPKDAKGANFDGRKLLYLETMRGQSLVALRVRLRAAVLQL